MLYRITVDPIFDLSAIINNILQIFWIPNRGKEYASWAIFLYFQNFEIDIREYSEKNRSVNANILCENVL